MNEALIDLKNLSCQAGYQYLLRDINWQVRPGEQWVVFGQNGCGKTTLLSIVAGYKGYSSGELRIFGQSYTPENILKLRKRIGWISSSFFDKCYSTEAVLDIVLSGLSGTLGLQFAIENADIITARRLLIELGLGDKILSPFDLLSKGERQQVLIARAFIARPELLILDEPGTGLDALAREKLLATIQALARSQETTIIYVTHYPEEILPCFDKCLLLRNSAIYRLGGTEALFTSEIMSDFFNYPVLVSRDTDKRYHFTIDSQAIAGFTDGSEVKSDV